MRSGCSDWLRVRFGSIGLEYVVCQPFYRIRVRVRAPLGPGPVHESYDYDNMAPAPIVQLLSNLGESPIL